MIYQQLASRGIVSHSVLNSMMQVPRHLFVPEDQRDSAYDDTPLPIGYEQTISQPYIVAYMTQEANIKPTDKVLEIGSGCGYAAAVLGNIAQEVYTVERIESLAERASNTLKDLGYDNVHTSCGDGSLGLPENAPYDAIIVTAGAPEIPMTLLSQLTPNGVMIIPVGKNFLNENLLRVTKLSDRRFEQEHLLNVRFVPLLGAEGWTERGAK